MRKLLVLSLLALSLPAGAQHVKTGTRWYDGCNDYTATVQEDGSVVMEAMSEGQELEFKMVPLGARQPDVYVVAKGINEYADMPFNEGYVLEYMKKEGMTVICAYDDKNQLVNVLVMTPDDSRHNNIWTWIPQIKGSYTLDPEGYRMSFGDLKLTVEGIDGEYEVQTFNDITNGVVEISHDFTQGLFEMVPTLDGFKVYQGSFDEYGLFQRSGDSYSLVESDPQKGRFDFASTLLLNRSIVGKYKRSTLRIMRNEIMARHGYVFQSEDLKDYFGNQPWYKPSEGDVEVRLSFIEQLNVELIKTAEADPYHDGFAVEE